MTKKEYINSVTALSKDPRFFFDEDSSIPFLCRGYKLKQNKVHGASISMFKMSPPTKRFFLNGKQYGEELDYGLTIVYNWND